MIFRAMASAFPANQPERHQDERVVFIEAANRDDARDRLPALLTSLWRVPSSSVEIWNLEPEFELITNPTAEGLSREQALFVIGWSQGKATFVNGQYGHPIFLLGNELDRLMETYISLPR
jgi:hypothetical protein